MTNTIHLQWQGQLYNSVENCVLSAGDNGAVINSVITGDYGNLRYLIRTNQNWETVYFEIISEQTRLSFQSDGKGNWLNEEFNGCIDIDISLTPFTNSLPINRLQLKIGEQQLVNILYVDVLEQQIKKVQQSYTRLSAFEYKYENVPNDFEAVITVDESGFVVNYPGLFTRTH